MDEKFDKVHLKIILCKADGMMLGKHDSLI